MAYPQTQPQAEPDADDAGKLSHAEVGYTMAKPGGDRCDHCKFYYGPNDCELVKAPIYPAGWCHRFQSSGNAMAAQPGAAGADTRAPAGVTSDPTASGAVPAAPSPSHVMAHGRAIAGAKALHAVGHISPAERDKHIGKSHAALRRAGRKPFGSFSPEVER